MGAGKRKFGSIAAFLGGDVQVDKKFIDKAYQLRSIVEENKDFEFLIEDVVSFEIEELSRAGNGFILIHTKKAEKKLTLDWKMDENVFWHFAKNNGLFRTNYKYYRRKNKILYLMWK